jgi:hypothetical protein
MKKIIMGAVLVATFSVVSPAMAHHSGAQWDNSKEISVNGTVKEFQFTNPHSWLVITATGADGKSEDWSFEAEGPSTLVRAGIKKKTFMPGDKVTIQAHPIKDGRLAGALMSATKADGSVFKPHAPAGPAAPAPAAGAN